MVLSLLAVMVIVTVIPALVVVAVVGQCLGLAYDTITDHTRKRVAHSIWNSRESYSSIEHATAALLDANWS